MYGYRLQHGSAMYTVTTRCQQAAHQLVGQARRRATKNGPKTVGGDIFGRFLKNFDKCQPEIAGDVISAAAAEHVSMDVRLKLGDSSSNRFRDIRAAQFMMDDGGRTLGQRLTAFCLTRSPP